MGICGRKEREDYTHIKPYLLCFGLGVMMSSLRDCRDTVSLDSPEMGRERGFRRAGGGIVIKSQLS